MKINSGKKKSVINKVINGLVMVISKIRIPVMLFFVYSFLGWVFEVIVFGVREHQFVNRGFLIGPCCSIYGYGCLIITYGLKRYRKNPLKLFFVSMIICSVFEYLTSFAMEIIFNGRWWDYGDNLFSLNGRVWLVTSLFFAFLVCLIVYYLRPFLIKFFRKIPKKILSAIVGVLLIIYLTDTIISMSFVFNLKSKFETFEDDVTKQVSTYVFDTIKSKFGID